MKKQTVIITTWLLTCSLIAHAEVSWIKIPEAQNIAAISSKFPVNNANQEAVIYNQSLLGQSISSETNLPYQAESRQYWLDTNAQKLSSGLGLPLTSKQAIIRINPLEVDSQTHAIGANQVELFFENEKIMPSVFADAEQLKAVGMPVEDHTIALKVNAHAGQLMLKVNGLDVSNKSGNKAYVVHVFEPDSTEVLKLTTDKQSYASGTDVVVKTSMLSNKSSVPMTVNGYITTPNGEKYTDLIFMESKLGEYQAVVPDVKGMSLATGLWEVHTLTEATFKGNKIMRDASTAFAVNLATATFNGDLKTINDSLLIGIDNAQPSRYEVRGVLSGFDVSGEKQAIALLMSAKWLETGHSNIELKLPLALIKESGLTAPFVIEQMSLKNQSLMAPVQHLTEGITIKQLPKIINNGLVK